MDPSDCSRIAESFNERAEDYRRNDWHRLCAERLVELTALKVGDSVLDAGTGTGFAALAIARKVGLDGYVLGVDVSSGMLEQARISISATDIQNIILLEADATDLNQYLPSAFDAVISAAALLYMSTARALGEWHRLLKSGGVLAFSTMKLGSPRAGQLFRQCAGAFGISLKDPSEALGSEERCRLALEKAGFGEVRIVQEEVQMTRPDLTQAWESNLRSAAHSAVRHLGAADQDEMRRHYEQLLTRIQNDDPRSLYRAEILYAFGRK